MNQEIKRWMGIDFGKVRIGIAVSDPLGCLARGLETINWNGRDMDWALNRIQEIIDQLAIGGIVIGLPRRTDGKSGETEELAICFAAELKAKTGLVIVMRDERYTTVIAGRYLRESGSRPDRRKAVIDQVAAEIILQEHLETLRK